MIDSDISFGGDAAGDGPVDTTGEGLADNFEISRLSVLIKSAPSASPPDDAGSIPANRRCDGVTVGDGPADTTGEGPADISSTPSSCYTSTPLSTNQAFASSTRRKVRATNPLDVSNYCVASNFSISPLAFSTA